MTTYIRTVTRKEYSYPDGDIWWDGIYKPILHLDKPIENNGSVVNTVEVNRRHMDKIHNGDIVEFKLSSESPTPMILNVSTDNSKTGDDVSEPTHCTVCNYPLSVNKHRQLYYHNKFTCPNQLIEGVRQFVSPNGFDIKGVFSLYIEHWYKRGDFNKVIDVFRYIGTNKFMFDMMGVMHHSEIVELTISVNRAKKKPLANMIVGICPCSSDSDSSYADVLASKFRNLTELCNADLNKLMFINTAGFTGRQAKEVFTFFNHPQNKEDVLTLIKELNK